ncbi:tape measure protein [Providencia stuartii]|uniref:tape measure protein n=1 Tax=Providencia stuartii TaxID=588 RepID=UPI0012B62238|nr:tape measure protein [Providencia stuartii]MTC11897.1 tape measure protein [Providencia stuartii]
MSTNLGEIVYDVSMDVQQLLVSQRVLEQRLGRLDSSFDRTSRSVDNASESMFSFSKAAMAVTSAISAGVIINAVDEWGQMAARIKMALDSAEGSIEKYGEIQKRFLEISNRNGKAVETTQEIYAGSASAMKELGYNTEQTIDYIESLSSAFTLNATSAMQTESATNALNRAMVTGVLRGNDWHSVLNAMPSVVGNIAKELSKLRGGVKVTENDVKKMAMTTGVSMKLFIDSMRGAKDENNALADSMDNTVADGFTKLANSAKAYFGELNQGFGVTRTMSAGFAVLSENFDKVASAAAIAAIVIGSRYATSLSASVKAKFSDIAASTAQAKATHQAALADQYAATTKVRKTWADKEAALSAVALAQAEYQVARGSAAEALALDNLIAKKRIATNASIAHAQAEKAEAAAIANTATAARAASFGVNALKSGLALLGGPLGVAMLAGGALLYFWQEAETAKQKALDFADAIEELKNKIKEMSYESLKGAIADANDSIDEQKKVIEELEDELEGLRTKYKYLKTDYRGWVDVSSKLVDAQRKVDQKTRDLKEAQDKLARTTKFVTMATEEMTSRVSDATSVFTESISKGNSLAQSVGLLAAKLKEAADAQRDLNDAQGEMQKTEAGEKYIQSLKDQNELLKIQDKTKRAITKAEIEAKKVTENKKQIEEAKKLAEENHKLAEAERKRESATKKSTSSDESEAKKRATQLAELASANKVAALETKGLYREAAILEAVLKLGTKATKAQIAEISELAGKEFDLKQTIKDREDAYKQNAGLQAAREQKLALEQLDRQLNANLITEELYQKRKYEIATQYANKIADINVTASVTNIEENRAKFDPIQALANENARKLAMMKEYYDQEQKLLSDSYAKQQITHEQFTVAKQATDMQYHMLLTAMDKQYQEQQTAAQWELMRNQSTGYEALASAIDSLGGNASNVMTGLLTKTMDMSDAARSLGNTILNSVLNSYVQLGVEMLKNFVLSKTLGVSSQAANAAAAAAGGTAALAAWTPAAIAASIATGGAASATGLGAFKTSMLSGQAMSMVGLAGARYNGGPVNAGEMYRVGEHGKPEIFKASTGKQYMIPGDNGRVISNKDMQGSGNGITLNIEFNDYSSGKHQFEAQASQNGDTLTVQAFLTDMQEKGPMHRSITQNTTATTRL